MNENSHMILPLTEVKQSLPKLLKKVETYHEVLTITKNGIPKGVLLALEDFESLLETLEILSDPEIMKSLRRSKKQAQKNKFYTDEEVWS